MREAGDRSNVHSPEQSQLGRQGSSKEEPESGQQEVATEPRGRAVGGPENSQMHRKAQEGHGYP